MTAIYKLLSVILLTTLLLIPNILLAENSLSIKYRPDSVDVAKPYFESIDTSESSLVSGAWYDKSHSYMIINLRGTNYHYCGLTNDVWNAFKLTLSKGSFYNNSIKGKV